MDMGFWGKKVLVLVFSQGLGKVVVVQLVVEGVDVMFVSRNEEKFVVVK